MPTLALVLSLTGILTALLVAIVVYIVAYIVCLLLARGGFATPAWIPAALAVIFFLLALLGDVSVA